MTIQYNPNYAGVYIHYPFCIQKCEYCDFFSIGNGIQKSIEEKSFLSFLLRELEIRLTQEKEWYHLTFTSLFFGGGTPSRMDPKDIQVLLENIFQSLHWQENPEITLEANPEDITKENLQAWHSIGINRISMGFQTSHSHLLEKVGRYYDSKSYKESPVLLANSQFKNFNIDLMYGFPGQTLDEFFHDLNYLLNFNPPHLSIYSLTLEKGTMYAKKVQQGLSKRPNESLQEIVFVQLPEVLIQKGYEWYEVSNFSKHGYACRHNLHYWTYSPYLGLGPSASGFTGKKRYTNPKNLKAYQTASFTETTPTNPLAEIALGIFRLPQPIQIREFFEVFNPQEREYAYKILDKWSKEGLATWDEKSHIFQWNSSGILHLDNRIQEFYEFCLENKQIP